MKTTHKAIEVLKLAYRKGYRVLEDGSVVNAADRPRKTNYYKPKGSRPAYNRFNIVTAAGTRYPVRVCQLQAYQKFGDLLFEDDVVVRHLDGNSLNDASDNIGLGTQSDNMMDRNPGDRIKHAQRAGKTNHNAELKVKADKLREKGLGYKRIREELGIPLSTLSYWYSDSAKKRALENR